MDGYSLNCGLEELLTDAAPDYESWSACAAEGLAAKLGCLYEYAKVASLNASALSPPGRGPLRQGIQLVPETRGLEKQLVVTFLLLP